MMKPSFITSSYTNRSIPTPSPHPPPLPLLGPSLSPNPADDHSKEEEDIEVAEAMLDIPEGKLLKAGDECAAVFNPHKKRKWEKAIINRRHDDGAFEIDWNDGCHRCGRG